MNSRPSTSLAPDLETDENEPADMGPPPFRTDYIKIESYITSSNQEDNPLFFHSRPGSKVRFNAQGIERLFEERKKGFVHIFVIEQSNFNVANLFMLVQK